MALTSFAAPQCWLRTRRAWAVGVLLLVSALELPFCHCACLKRRCHISVEATTLYVYAYFLSKVTALITHVFCHAAPAPAGSSSHDDRPGCNQYEKWASRWPAPNGANGPHNWCPLKLAARRPYTTLHKWYCALEQACIPHFRCENLGYE